MAKKKKHKIPTDPEKYAKYCRRRDALIDGDQKKYTKGTQTHKGKNKYSRKKKHKNS
jgi:hypothetical protein